MGLKQQPVVGQRLEINTQLANRGGINARKFNTVVVVESVASNTATQSGFLVEVKDRWLTSHFLDGIYFVGEGDKDEE